MKLAVVGTRTFINKKIIYDELDLIHKEIEISLIVSGGARGVDSIAVLWAKDRKIPFKEYKAKWDDLNAPGAIIKTNSYGNKYNAMAGMQRNSLIIDTAEKVVAFWDRKSSGTGDSIRKAISQNKLLKIIDTNYTKNKHT